MDRRSFLAVGVAGIGLFSGCPSQQNTTTDPPTQPETEGRTGTPSAQQSDTRTETEEPAQTPAENEDVIFVGPAGSDEYDGSEETPLASIQTAIHRVRPGETIQVLPGEYREFFSTKRSGEPEKPITITGPESAVVRPPEELPEGRIFAIVPSHLHLRGMTFDGLAHPQRSDDPASYANNVIDAMPPTWQDTYPDYLTDVTIKPDAIGNARRHVLGRVRTNHLEIGEFQLIGPAGAKYLSDENATDHLSGGIVSRSHKGEVVQIGAKHNVFDEGEGDSYVWDTPDESHDIHVHHIDNSAGHPHTELVELGTSVYDATIEYCTDAGGAGMYFLSADHENWTETSMGLRGGRCTLRWCTIENGYGPGVQIGTPPGLDRNLDRYNLIPDERFPGRNNAVSGNRIVNNAGPAIAFPYEIYNGTEIAMGPDEQAGICGNEYNGGTQADPDVHCPEEVPGGDGMGHTGGESPWN